MSRFPLSRSVLSAAMLAGSFAAQAPALAHEYKVGAIVIEHPWSRATPGGAKVGGGYFVLQNKGEADRLVSVAAPSISDKVQIHEMATSDGVMKMRLLPDGVAVPAGGEVAFKPGGYHVMFMDLKQPLKKGDKVKATLTFEKAGTADVEFNVEDIGAPAPEHHHGTMN